MTPAGRRAATGPHALTAVTARIALVSLLALAGCAPAGYGSTLLPTAQAGAPAPEYRVVVPDGYDVRSVDYDASLVGIASGEATSTVVRGRGVISVYATERATGAEVVLVYDDVQNRPTPSAVIRLDRAPPPQARR